MDYPRVLVLSPIVFNAATGSGVTMGNLFRGWPQDRLAQVHCDGHNTPDLTVCRHYFQLPNEPLWQGTAVKTTTTLLRHTTSYLLRRRETLLAHWLHPQRLLDWCRDFAPDLIYARPHDRPSFFTWLPRLLGRELAIPYTTWVLDDWPRRYETSPNPAKRLFWQVVGQRHLQQAFDGAAANIAISGEMATAFAERYKRPFTHFHNTIDTSDWATLDKTYTAATPFRLVYIGSVEPDKELHSLRDVGHVLQQLADNGRQVQLTIYGPDKYRQTVAQHLEQPPLVVHGGLFAAADKPHVLNRADLLLLPINFDTVSQNYVGYSFQTKVPEYMASATPTLVYGPPTSPNVRYAQREQWAAVVAERNLDYLHQTLIRLMDDQPYRTALGQRAQQLAFTNHDGTAVRARFRQLLTEIAKRGDWEIERLRD